ncbi:MAG: coenzyme F420-0:L-glutamate ligase / coenzyme F420:gamma-L-glutamate ligase [Solirubrobacteraceae bacterium]|jgi:coenzyme F420-0:L-glutamate ligase/coenzyme F420-1:gamma-L-glutamate ligase|nr:coenzyme F420-0:L-glutamate ligase / coenzyme F420:gamma-L-glutamate ligase [Solirubrobacteraceae bacterium]
MTLTAVSLTGLPEVAAGDDLAALIVAAGEPVRDGDVVCVAHKVVSKAAGRVRRLADVEPGDRARELAEKLGGRDPRHVQVVLDETVELLRDERVLICRTRHGFVCANAGVDASNASEPDTLVLLPEDPDASARTLRERLRELTGAAPAVLVTDSFGRAWRQGQAEVAIGCAGLTPLDDWRGRADRAGRELSATWIAVADQAAAAADLARSGKDSGEPVAIVRGLDRFVTDDDGPGAAALLRPPEEDLFG